MWYSLEYLPLAEATVITFLGPNLAGYWCHLLLRDPYTRTEQFASLLALGGVVLITKPASLFSGSIQAKDVVETALGTLVNTTLIATGGPDITESIIIDPHMPTSAERLGAIGIALLGVLGGSFAFTTLRAIGKRAHPLISVNYFSSVCVIVTFCVLSLAPLLGIGQPGLQLELPSSLRQWGLVLFVTACGLAMQVLITKGLAAERSNRATAMTYTHMLFAAGFDRFIWGTTMGWMSATGCTMILTGALWVAVGKKEATGRQREEGEGDIERADATGSRREEDIPMLREELEDDGNDVVLERMR
jgi:drug/metabolite transporter (DMT)-like permease